VATLSGGGVNTQTRHASNCGLWSISVMIVYCLIHAYYTNSSSFLNGNQTTNSVTKNEYSASFQVNLNPISLFVYPTHASVYYAESPKFLALLFTIVVILQDYYITRQDSAMVVETPRTFQVVETPRTLQAAQNLLLLSSASPYLCRSHCPREETPLDTECVANTSRHVDQSCGTFSCRGNDN
jgi:hypothetical protein